MDIDLSAAPRPFVLLDGVSAVGDEALRAWRQLRQAPFWHIWEAAAQCAALHQRHRCGFERHAFLLGMAWTPAAAAWGLPEGHVLDGRLELLARLTQQGDGAALYALEATYTSAADGDCRRAGWEVRIGLCAYDGRFRADRLRERYEELFRCLCRGGTV